MKPLEVIDICCGGGLLAAGIQRVGFKIIMGIDNDPVALSSFADNFPGAMIWETDLLDVYNLPKCDIIIGGPPCQPFSKANRDQDHAKGLPLVNKFIELAQGSNVKYYIMEEVPPVLEYVKDKVPRAEIWECADFGAKNLRPRLFAGDFPDPVAPGPPCENPVKTVMASDNDIPIESMREYQGVPSWMIFNGNETQQRAQIGNGVPLPMGEALGLGIAYDIQKREQSGHLPWHKTTALFHRRRGGNRAYLSSPGWLWCENCKTCIKK